MDIFIAELCLRIIEAFTKCCSTLQKQKPDGLFLGRAGFTTDWPYSEFLCRVVELESLQIHQLYKEQKPLLNAAVLFKNGTLKVDFLVGLGSYQTDHKVSFFVEM